MEAATANDNQTACSGHLVSYDAAGMRDTVAPRLRAEIEAWRTEREARLKADDGWLTLTDSSFSTRRQYLRFVTAERHRIADWA